jgi:dynein heavy chain 1
VAGAAAAAAAAAAVSGHAAAAAPEGGGDKRQQQDQYENKFVEHASRDLVAAIRPMFAEFVPSALAFALSRPHIMDTSQGRLLMTLKCAVLAGVQHVAEYNEAHADFPLGPSQVHRFAERWLVMSLIWAFGGSMDFKGRVELGKAIGSMTTVDLPPGAEGGAMLVDYEVYVEDGEWHLWKDKVPQIEIESHQVLQTDMVIPTVDTVRHKSALRGWLAQHKPLVLCGPPGSGKSMTLIATLSSLPELELVWLNFSSGTQPELVLKVFDQYCEFTKEPDGWTVAPTQQGKWLCIFCDEINLPATDNYNTQKVITFLRQLVSRNGFWRCTKKAPPTWVRLERIQFVGACNPPTDPGRVPLAHRFLAQAPVLLVDFPAPESLRQIYGTFCRGLVKMQPDVRGLAGPLTEAMVELYVVLVLVLVLVVAVACITY